MVCKLRCLISILYVGLIYSYAGINGVELRLSLEQNIPVLRITQDGLRTVAVYGSQQLPYGVFTPIEVTMTSQEGTSPLV